MTIHHRVRHAFTLLSILYMIADLDLLSGISLRIRQEISLANECAYARPELVPG
jgi:hypothetical protein